MKMNNKIYDAGANAVMDFAYTGTVTWYGTDYNVKSGQVMFGSIRF